MDLVDTLRKKIDVLHEGDYLPGLKSVLLHIETAFRHLSRGQDSDDETAFTDAIYRTNQAFEGSIKEAYRVLAGQDPSRMRPFDIESYLEKNNTFRSRVLSQMTTYRTEWRNPSAHDYKLDFDESEAFLAIVSVSAFSCLLLDQIAERLAFNTAQADAESHKMAIAATLEKSKNARLLERATELLGQFCLHHLPQSSGTSKQSESQTIGALHGFISSVAPDLTVETEVSLDSGGHYHPDLFLERAGEKVVVEIKRRMMKQSYLSAVAQVENYMTIGSIRDGIVLFLPEGPSEMLREERVHSSSDGNIMIMVPTNAGGP
jgi:hypothetical protein